MNETTPADGSDDHAAPTPEPGRAAAFREIRYHHSPNLVPLLAELRCSLLVSTYAAGKLAVVGTADNALTLSFLNFDQCMGIAVSPQKIAVGSRHQIWFLNNACDLASQLQPPGHYDGCYLPRSSFVTARIHGHDLAWAGQELWVVNTLFSCLCTLQDDYNFVPRWKPPFISRLAGNDRCHLNGLAMQEGRPRYVTAMAETDEPGGWRPTKSDSGCLIDVDSGETISRGFAMPHSPRMYNGNLFVLNSGAGELGVVDTANGKYQPVEQMPGYTRGLGFCGPFAFVGLSQIRETSVFGGVPIAEKRDELRCGVAVVDLRSGRSVAKLEFVSGVNEIFAVDVLPAVRNPLIREPVPADETTPDVWVVPPEGQVDSMLGAAATATAQRSRTPGKGIAQRAVSLVNRANELQHADRFEDAARLYREAIAESPQLATVHVARGRISGGDHCR